MLRLPSFLTWQLTQCCCNAWYLLGSTVISLSQALRGSANCHSWENWCFLVYFQYSVYCVSTYINISGSSIALYWIQYSNDKHGDVIKWKHFPRYWPFVRGIHWWPVNSPHKGQWRGALMFSSIYAWINVWVNNREAGDLRRHHAHYDVTVMSRMVLKLRWWPCMPGCCLQATSHILS